MISLIVYYGPPPTTINAVSATIVAGWRARIRLNMSWYKYITFYINLLNWTKPFNNHLGKYMRKAVHHLNCVDSSNKRRWRGEQLHHLGGGVCWLFVLLWMDLRCCELIACKKWYKNNLKMRLAVLLFDPLRCAPHLQRVHKIECLQLNHEE